MSMRVIDPDGRTVASGVSAFSVSEELQQNVLHHLSIPKPRLWSDKNPQLYRLIIELRVEDELVDIVETRFGIRSCEFDSEKGFLLNGERVKLNGVCLHHDGGCVGAAVPIKIWERRLKILKEMGANAIRCSHNPPDPGLLDLCDELGFLVMDEAFDEWRFLKGKAFGSNTHESRGYSEWFEQNYRDDLSAMVLRDRNHPSVIMWSIGNEIPEQTSPEGHLLARELIDICKKLDPTRLVTVACDQIEAEPRKATPEFLDTLDIVGYNYTGRWRSRAETLYDDDKRKYPHRLVLGTENSSTAGRRGFYGFKGELTEWSRPYYSMPVAVGKLLKYTMTHDYVAGDFMWTGVDYLGEAHWPHRSSNAGVLDTCGFPKDGYYFYKSIWNRETPMVHALPHWNIDAVPGTVIPVLCYTNCEYAEFLLNGKSYGKKAYAYPAYGMTEKYGHYDKPRRPVNTDDLFLAWDVPYEPGVLEVAGYNGGGEVCRFTSRTAGKPARLAAAADAGVIRADGRDIVHIEIRVEDAEGNFAASAENEISVSVSGAGRLLGLDNGRSDSHEIFSAGHMRAFSGMLLAIVQSNGEAGEITVEITGEGIHGAEVRLLARNYG
jgi:beta-galactosidase